MPFWVEDMSEDEGEEFGGSNANAACDPGGGTTTEGEGVLGIETGLRMDGDPVRRGSMVDEGVEVTDHLIDAGLPCSPSRGTTCGADVGV